jgi:hypothetical protein
VRAGLLLAGLAWEIGWPILYDNSLNPGAVIPLGLGAMREQVGSAPRIACGFRFIPAGYSDVKPAPVPI